ncbi:response regulator [Roseateles sp. 22389]|uniref:response regulator n=1 Tax=Roseateles sp. 22389 TaxID=3453916 RepID=UPI003F830F4B
MVAPINRRILLVEDNDLFLEALPRLLDSPEFALDFESAKDTQHALSKVQSFQPHLVSLDLNLLDACNGGMYVLKEIAQAQCALPLILVFTGASDDIFRQAGETLWRKFQTSRLGWLCKSCGSSEYATAVYAALREVKA